MRFSILEKTLKEKKQILEHQYCRHIVLGDDLSSHLLLQHLRQKYDAHESKMLFYKDPQGNEWNFPGPTLLRGEENAQLLKALFPKIETSPKGIPSKFLKDQSFRPFAGKSRPGKILEGEEFFTYNKFPLDLSSFFPEMGHFQSAEQNAESDYFLGNITQIEFIPEGEQAKDQSCMDSSTAFWRLLCSENKVYECEQLFFAYGPRKFYQLLKDKDRFSSRFHEFCLKIRNHPCFILTFQSKGEIADEEGTLFIPQSQTHEWGHFIGEFSPYDPEKRIQNFSFMSFIEENESAPELISKKIRLMKRMIGKIFPNFSKVSISETILITDKIPGLHEIDDQLFDSVKEELRNFSFIGMQSPLAKNFFEMRDIQASRDSLSHLVRSLASYVQASEQLY